MEGISTSPSLLRNRGQKIRLGKYLVINVECGLFAPFLMQNVSTLYDVLLQKLTTVFLGELCTLKPCLSELFQSCTRCRNQKLTAVEE